jgi:hypothetical protein
MVSKNCTQTEKNYCKSNSLINLSNKKNIRIKIVSIVLVAGYQLPVARYRENTNTDSGFAGYPVPGNAVLYYCYHKQEAPHCEVRGFNIFDAL